MDRMPSEERQREICDLLQGWVEEGEEFRVQGQEDSVMLSECDTPPSLRETHPRLYGRLASIEARKADLGHKRFVVNARRPAWPPGAVAAAATSGHP